MTLLRHTLDVLAPAVCQTCGEPLVGAEQMLCLDCLTALPRWAGDSEGTITRRLMCRMPVRRVHALFTYIHQSPYAALLREGKYADLPGAIHLLGTLLARQLTAENVLLGVDALVPMPLHWLKRAMRGYNQAEIIAQEISKRTGIPVVSPLKARWHGSQARRTATQRQNQQSNIFSATAGSLHGMHIALVDDVITTGTTMSHALDAAREAGGRMADVVALAVTE